MKINRVLIAIFILVVCFLVVKRNRWINLLYSKDNFSGEERKTGEVIQFYQLSKNV